MTIEDTIDAGPAPLSGGLLARKGSASAGGFTAAHGAPAAVLQGNHRRRRILIMENHGLNRKMLTDLFRVHGYQPVCVADPQEALMVARGCHPDLAVIDVGLPGGGAGGSGLETIARLKHDDGLARIPVIAVSASVRPHEVAVICNSGCDDFLAMPFPVKRMLARVALLLH